jgi:hypothetical protein
MILQFHRTQHILIYMAHNPKAFHILIQVYVIQFHINKWVSIIKELTNIEDLDMVPIHGIAKFLNSTYFVCTARELGCNRNMSFLANTYIIS